MRISERINHLIGIEGGYVNHPADRGGETIWGITIAVAKEFGYHGPMKSMPRSVAEQIYTERYWLRPKFPLIESISEPLVTEMFDTGVNMHPTTAVRFLQEALNAFNNKLFLNLVTDGAVGYATLSALKAFLSKHPEDGELQLLKALNSLQGCRYIGIANSDARQRVFTFGWFRQRVGL